MCYDSNGTTNTANGWREHRGVSQRAWKQGLVQLVGMYQHWPGKGRCLTLPLIKRALIQQGHVGYHAVTGGRGVTQEFINSLANKAENGFSFKVGKCCFQGMCALGVAVPR